MINIRFYLTIIILEARGQMMTISFVNVIVCTICTYVATYNYIYVCM